MDSSSVSHSKQSQQTSHQSGQVSTSNASSSTTTTTKKPKRKFRDESSTSQDVDKVNANGTGSNELAHGNATKVQKTTPLELKTDEKLPALILPPETTSVSLPHLAGSHTPVPAAGDQTGQSNEDAAMEFVDELINYVRNTSCAKKMEAAALDKLISPFRRISAVISLGSFFKAKFKANPSQSVDDIMVSTGFTKRQFTKEEWRCMHQMLTVVLSFVIEQIIEGED